MFGETIQPFTLSPELTNPANTVLPASDFTPPDNKEPIPNIISGNLGWNWQQYYDLTPTNSVPVVATQPAATVPDVVNNPSPGDSDFIGPVAPATNAQAVLEANKTSPLLIVGGVIAALYLLNA
jgi:hypothetical protein